MLTLFGKLHGTCAGRSGVWCLLIFLSFLATVILAQDFRESRKLRLATERLLKNEISKFSDDERRSARYGHILQQIRRPLRYEEQTPGNCDNSVVRMYCIPLILYTSILAHIHNLRFSPTFIFVHINMQYVLTLVSAYFLVEHSPLQALAALGRYIVK